MERVLEKTLVRQGASAGPGFPWDTVFAVACMVAGAWGLGMVLEPRLWTAFLPSDPGGIRVGTVSRKAGILRVRGASSPVWLDLLQKRSAWQGDAVFTGEDGYAEIELPSGHRVEVLPNSLVRLELPPASEQKRGFGWALRGVPPRLNVEKGRFRVKVATLDPRLEIRAAGQKVELGSQPASQVDVEVDPNQTGAPLLVRAQERIDLRVNDRPVSIEKKQTLWVRPSQAGRQAEIIVSPFRILAPKDGERRLEASDTLTLSFEWEGYDEKAGPLRLELRGAENRVLSLPAKTSSHTLKLKPGDYQWRVLPAQGTRGVVPWAGFKFEALRAPWMLAPALDAQWRVEGLSRARVNFVWEKFSDALSGEVEVVRTDRSEPPQYLALEVPAGAVELSRWLELGPGQYRWRARSRAVGRALVSPWGPEGHFSVVQVREKPPAPAAGGAGGGGALAQPSRSGDFTVKRPEVALVAGSASSQSTRLGSINDDLDRLKVDLAWDKVAGAKEYQVTVTKDGEEYLRLNTEKPHLRLELKELAKKGYDYVIEATLEGGRIVKSGRIPIVIEMQPPRLQEPPKGAVRDLNSRLLMTWEKTLLTTEYQLQVAADRKFEKILTDHKGADNFNYYYPSRTGQLFWRVRAISGSQMSTWSTTGEFTAN